MCDDIERGGVEDGGIGTMMNGRTNCNELAFFVISD